MSGSSSRATYIPRSYLASLPPDSEISIGALVAEQDRLADEAREAMPFAFDECSYGKGYVRQSVWSCIDCGGRGVCYGCSISCHADHQLVELWTRRHFRCDCPTTCMQPEPPAPKFGHTAGKRRCCILNPPQIQPAEENAENRYNRNFKGEFCRCGRTYDPMEETEGMLCCIACEDWFHESCLNLRPLPTLPSSAANTPKKPSHLSGPSHLPGPTTLDDSIPGGTVEPDVDAGPSATQDTVEEDDDEAGILIPSESYDGLICGECVAAHPALAARKGKVGWMVIVSTEEGGLEVKGRPADWGASQVKIGADSERLAVADDERSAGQMPSAVVDSNKRGLEDESDHPDAKRVKLDLPVGGEGKGDVFLARGERQILKEELDAETIKTLPFPLDDEEIYEPPKDEKEEETLDEVTARMVDTLPRAQAIEAVHGYQRLKDRLQSMLAGHAVDGRVVSKDDIEAMFRDLKGRAG